MAVVGSYEDLKVESLGDGVAQLTLNRPERLNAMRAQTRRELVAALGSLNEDTEVAAILMTGSGDKAFAAGQDLSESAKFTENSTDEWEASWNRLYHAMLDMEKPVVAAIHGYAVGAACHLTLLCDLRLGDEDARFGVAEIDDGIPCINGTLFLNEFVGRGRAAELVLTGRMIDAQTALAWGILNRIVPKDELMTAAIAEVKMLASKPRRAMLLDKRWMRELLIDKLAKSYAFGVQAQADVFATRQPQQRMEDFLNDRRDGRST